MTTTEYNRCVDLFSDNIFRFALKSVRDASLANDVVQDTFMRLWQNVSEVDFERVKSYLFRIAHNLMIDHFRKNKRNADFELVDQNQLSFTQEYSDIKEQLEKAVDTLPQVQKTVLMLRDYEGYSYNEIGEVAGLNKSQVKVYIYRARKTMKDYLISTGIEL